MPESAAILETLKAELRFLEDGGYGWAVEAEGAEGARDGRGRGILFGG